MKFLFLIGYMGCGKSTLGRKLARRLKMPFCDTDSLIEQREGAAVADIFQYQGEEYFRCLERKALDEALGGQPGVVSTGGGLPIWSDNLERMNQVGMTVYLRRTPEQIIRRLSPYGRQKRPRFRGLDDRQLLEFITRNMAEREAFYSRAQVTIDCTQLSDEGAIRRIMDCFSTSDC